MTRYSRGEDTTSFSSGSITCTGNFEMVGHG